MKDKVLLKKTIKELTPRSQGEALAGVVSEIIKKQMRIQSRARRLFPAKELKTHGDR